MNKQELRDLWFSINYHDSIDSFLVVHYNKHISNISLFNTMVGTTLEDLIDRCNNHK